MDYVVVLAGVRLYGYCNSGYNLWSYFDNQCIYCTYVTGVIEAGSSGFGAGHVWPANGHVQGLLSAMFMLILCLFRGVDLQACGERGAFS